MTGMAARPAHGRPLPDGPAPFTTLIELTFQKQKVEHWIRFGRKSYEQIIDRRRSIVGFAPEASSPLSVGPPTTTAPSFRVSTSCAPSDAANRSKRCLSFVPAARSCCGSRAGDKYSGRWP